MGALGFLVASKVRFSKIYLYKLIRILTNSSPSRIFQIYKDYGFVAVFLVSALCFTIALLYGIFFIEEQPGKSIQDTKVHHIFREIFDIRSVQDTIATVARKRQGPLRM